jgi:aminoglycoside 6'-N-acetyltransferase I
MVQVRPAVAADADAWLLMRMALWPDATGAEHRRDIDRYFAGERREPAQVLLAVDADGRAVGFAELSIRNIVDSCTTGRVGYLEGWYVSPDARRQGVGRALVAAAERWAAGAGCTEFGSDSGLDNTISHAAHLALGFEETGQVRTYRKDVVPGRQN